MAEQEAGIKETQEARKALKLLIVKARDLLSDGFQAQDAMTFALYVLQNPDIAAGYEGTDEIDDEFRDLDAQELRILLHAAVDFGIDLYVDSPATDK